MAGFGVSPLVFICESAKNIIMETTNTTHEHGRNEMSNDALKVLEIIRRTHDTTNMDTDMFSELCRATCFYLKGGIAPEKVAELVIEEMWTPAA